MFKIIRNRYETFLTDMSEEGCKIWLENLFNYHSGDSRFYLTYTNDLLIIKNIVTNLTVSYKIVPL